MRNIKLHRGWETYRTDHFIFTYSRRSVIKDCIREFAQQREQGLLQITDYLEIDISSVPVILFFVYNSNKEAEYYLGTGTRLGFAEQENMVIHTLYNQTVGHELTHLVSSLLADEATASRVLSEGLAALLDLSGADYPGYLAALAVHKILPELEQLLSNPGFEQYPLRNYPAAAGFVQFLVETHGLVLFKALWQGTSRHFHTAITDQLLTIYPVDTPAALDKQWLAFTGRQHTVPGIKPGDKEKIEQLLATCDTIRAAVNRDNFIGNFDFLSLFDKNNHTIIGFLPVKPNTCQVLVQAAGRKCLFNLYTHAGEWEINYQVKVLS